MIYDDGLSDSDTGRAAEIRADVNLYGTRVPQVRIQDFIHSSLILIKRCSEFTYARYFLFSGRVNILCWNLSQHLPLEIGSRAPYECGQRHERGLPVTTSHRQMTCFFFQDPAQEISMLEVRTCRGPACRGSSRRLFGHAGGVH